METAKNTLRTVLASEKAVFPTLGIMLGPCRYFVAETRLNARPERCTVFLKSVVRKVGRVQGRQSQLTPALAFSWDLSGRNQSGTNAAVSGVEGSR